MGTQPKQQSIITPNVKLINQQRLTPQVQLINNSALSTLTAINNVNMMNMRNRMTVNNILMNAALHNAQRRTHGIAPRIINSHSLQNRQYALMQQQSLLTQQAALNRLRMNSAINPSIMQPQTMRGNTLNTPIMPQPNYTTSIPSELLDSTINDLKSVMSSSDPLAVTNAINAAFIKLGANDPDSKKRVLQQLVAKCQSVNELQTNQNEQQREDGNGKKKKKKRDKSKRSKSKKRKREKSKKERKRRKKRERQRSRDRRSRSKEEMNADFPDPDKEEKNVKKRKLPIETVPDFDITPPASKRLKVSESPSLSPK